MNYTQGRVGRVFVVRFDHGDDVVACLTDLARRESVRCAAVWLLGALARGRLVTGPETLDLPPTPHWVEFDDGREVIGFGTIFWAESEPKAHLHGSFGRGDHALTGCLRAESETYLIAEGVVLEIADASAERVRDAASGLALLRIGV